jgi:radical SAM protein with 4Fe4S-binding SPASM domain
MNTTLAQRINTRASAHNVPLSIVAEVTWRCNLRCYFCYQKHQPKACRNELSLSAWSSLFRQLADAGGLYLTLTGGEPFMRSDIIAIVAAARECGFAVSIITNGTLVTRRIARALAAQGIVDVGVSLHAAHGALHDRLTGNPGSFSAALRSIRILRECGIAVIVKHTVSAANFGQYRAIRDLTEKNDWLFECDSFVVPAAPERRSPYALNRAQHEQFAQDMNAALEFTEGNAHLHCDAGRSVAGITPCGNVVPCIQLPLSFGSLRTTAFDRIWSGARARSFRKREERLSAECETCGIRNYCSRCHGLAFFEKGDFRGRAPSCCVRAGATQGSVRQHL